LQRGAVIAVGVGDGTSGSDGTGGSGGRTLAFSLLAAASAAGSWCAAVGTADPGMLAIAELGVELDRLALVPRPGGMWPEVTGSLLDGMDIVLVCPPGRVRPGVARRLAARARQRRAVLVVEAGPAWWPEGPDVRLTVEGGGWDGVERGHGHLRGRQVVVVSSGRRSAVRGTRHGLWLPAASGAVAAG
jgi:hypothetical protein